MYHCGTNRKNKNALKQVSRIAHDRSNSVKKNHFFTESIKPIDVKLAAKSEYDLTLKTF